MKAKRKAESYSNPGQEIIIENKLKGKTTADVDEALSF
jgi:hypothetical protein